ncbi:branched-chain amino acid ABC transporter permease [Geminicoccaceae bacterium 1502E]|nr:branched-chain amino acid ABC transporter permease [Geminicoccaceae bacterium 1502E]
MLACLAIVSLLPAGCAAERDDAAETCMRLVPALVPPDARLALVAPLVPQPDDGTAVRFVLATANGLLENRLTCRFAQPTPWGPPRLTEVVGPDGPVDALTLFLLRDYWLPGGGGRELVRRAPPPGGAGQLLQQLLNALAGGSIYALLAVAYSLVYGLIGRIHLAFGDLAMVGGHGLFVLLVSLLASAPALGLPLVFLLAAGGGTALAALLARQTGSGPALPLWHGPGHAALIATLGLSLALREAVRLAQGAREAWLPPLLGGALTLPLPDGTMLHLGAGQLLAGATALAAYASLAFLLHGSAFGRTVRACADDAPMAALCGIDPARTLRAVFAIGGAFAALAGAVMLLVYGTIGVEGGFLLGLKAITAALLGGMGSVHGAMLGGLLIGLLESGWAVFFGGQWREVAVFALLALVLLLRPGGLAGQPPALANDRFRPR